MLCFKHTDYLKQVETSSTSTPVVPYETSDDTQPTKPFPLFEDSGKSTPLRRLWNKFFSSRNFFFSRSSSEEASVPENLKTTSLEELFAKMPRSKKKRLRQRSLRRLPYRTSSVPDLPTILEQNTVERGNSHAPRLHEHIESLSSIKQDEPMMQERIEPLVLNVRRGELIGPDGILDTPILESSLETLHIPL